MNLEDFHCEARMNNGIFDILVLAGSKNDGISDGQP
jgi:hypothetical protein